MPNYMTELSPDNNSHVYQIKDKEAFPRAEQAVLGAKNSLNIELSVIKSANTSGTWNGNEYTFRGITWTVNSDMTISASGTASGGNSNFTLVNSNLVINNRKLCGCPSGGSISTYYLRASKNATYDDVGNGVLINDTINYMTCTIINGYNASAGLTFKPMLLVPSDSDDTYVPYAMTNRELTDAVTAQISTSDFTLAQNVEFLNNDNHLEANVGNIKFISVKVKGLVANANTWVNVATLSGSLKPISNKILSGMCQKNASAETCDCIIENNTLKIRRSGSAITATDLYNIMFIYV